MYKNRCFRTPALDSLPGPFASDEESGQGRAMGVSCGRLWGPGLEVVYLVSTHIPLARTQWHGPISLQGGLGNVVFLCPGETQAREGFLQWSSVPPPALVHTSTTPRQEASLISVWELAWTARMPGRKSTVVCKSGTKASPSPFAM